MNIKTLFENGQSQFQDTFRKLIYQNYPAIFDKLDYYNDDHFIDSLLFGYFNGLKGISLEQIVGNELGDLSNLNVTGDRYGVGYVPNHGYYSSDTPNAKIAIGEDNFDPVVVLEKHNNIELCLHTNPYFTHLMEENGGNEDCIKGVPTQPHKYKKYISEAFDLIKKYCPEEYDFYIKSTRKIVLYEKEGMRSFVTRLLHGTIFLSVDKCSTTGFFIEELIHQCSHNVFNAVTFDTTEYLKIDPYLQLSSLIDKDPSLENRDIFGAYHGVYTVSTGVNSMLSMILSGELEEDLHHEMLGRIAIKKPRFRTGIERVNFEEVFTKKGIEMYNFLDERCAEQLARYPEIFNVYDFSNQRAVFDLQRFMDLNKTKIFS